MGVFIGLLGFLGLIAGLLSLVISIIKRAPKKNALLVIGIAFLLFVTGLATTPPPDDNQHAEPPAAGRVDDNESAPDKDATGGADT